MTEQNRPALLLAAFGSATEPRTNAAVRRLARRMERSGACGPVGVAFLSGEPHFSRGLEFFGDREVLVVPLAGRLDPLARRRLAADLGRSRTPRRFEVIHSPTASPAFRERLGRRLWELCAAYGLEPTETSAILVGPGAQDLARELQLLGPVGQVRAANDSGSGLSQVLDELEPGSAVIVLPVLFGETGPTRDLPRGIRAALNGASEPVSLVFRGGTVVVDRPNALDDELAGAVLDVLAYARSLRSHSRMCRRRSAGGGCTESSSSQPAMSRSASSGS